LYEVLLARNPTELHGATLELEQHELDDLVNYLLQIDNTAREDEVGRPEPVQPEPANGMGVGGDVVAGARPGAGAGAGRGGACAYSPSSERPKPLAFLFVALCLGWVARRRHTGR
jgi:hypothetical protein